MVESVMAVLLSCGEVQDLTSSRQGAAVTTQVVTLATANYRVAVSFSWNRSRHPNAFRECPRFGQSGRSWRRAEGPELAMMEVKYKA